MVGISLASLPDEGTQDYVRDAEKVPNQQESECVDDVGMQSGSKQMPGMSDFTPLDVCPGSEPDYPPPPSHLVGLKWYPLGK